MTDAKMVKTIYIKAPRELVWSYLTEPDKLGRWFHESTAVLKAGEDYKLLRENPADAREPMCWGKVLIADEPTRLVYTFTHPFMQGVETQVEWNLEERSGGTQLTMTHTGLDANSETALTMLMEHDKGWDRHFMRLREVANMVM